LSEFIVSVFCAFVLLEKQKIILNKIILVIEKLEAFFIELIRS
jgi:hypothetical protein